MTTKSERQEQQARALIEFEGLISRPVPCFKWYTTKIKEPAEFRLWRMYASLSYRIDLWLEAGLPAWPELAKMISDAHANEREAYNDWIKLKKRISAEYVDGRRKTRPPWGIRA